MRISNNLEVNAEQYGNIYLLPAIYLSILLTGRNANLWLMENCPSQYVRIHNQCDLIYRNGYIKAYDEMTSLDSLLNYLDVEPMPESFYWSPSIADLLIDTIDQKKYIVLDLDEYYIEQTYFYRRRHYYRKFMIYGYDRKACIIKAYSHDEWTRYRPFALDILKLPQIVQLGARRSDTANRFTYRGLFIRRNPSCSVFFFSPHRFLFRLNSCLENRMVKVYSNKGDLLYTDLYGFQLYETIIKKIQLLKQNIVHLDYRVFSILGQHKARMAQTITYLEQAYRIPGLSEIAETYKNLAGQWKKLLLIFLKPYRDHYPERYQSIDEIVQQVTVCKEREKSCLCRLIEKIRGNI